MHDPFAPQEAQARTLTVIEVALQRGLGVRGDPVRQVIAYFDLDGDFLAERDDVPAAEAAARMQGGGMTTLDERAEELARLSEAATSGPWELLTSTDYHETTGLPRPGTTEAFGVGSGQTIGMGLVCGSYMEFYGAIPNFGANAAFIVAAVNYVRDMLAAPVETT